MIPNDQFYFIKNNQVSPDATSLTQLYQPIMGADARAVYDFLVAFFDHGRAVHRFAEILNQVLFGQDRLWRSLDVLGALGLIRLYRADQAWVIKLNSPLDRETFLGNPVLRTLLANTIGEFSVAELTMTLPKNLVDQTKSFSEVFTDKGQLQLPPRQDQPKFELDYFKREMVRNNLVFKDEAEAVLGLYHLADRYRKNWYELLLLAKETAVDHTISLERIQVKLGNLAAAPAQPSPPSDDQTAALVRLVKGVKAQTFLDSLKKERQGFVTAEEKALISALSQQGLLDEVINFLVLYTLQKTKSNNLNKVYLHKVANDLLYHGVTTAQEAMAYLNRGQRVRSSQATRPSKTNVPEWSNPDYKEELTEEERRVLDRQMDELMAQLDEEE